MRINKFTITPLLFAFTSLLSCENNQNEKVGINPENIKSQVCVSINKDIFLGADIDEIRKKYNENSFYPIEESVPEFDDIKSFEVDSFIKFDKNIIMTRNRFRFHRNKLTLFWLEISIQGENKMPVIRHFIETIIKCKDISFISAFIENQKSGDTAEITTKNQVIYMRKLEAEGGSDYFIISYKPKAHDTSTNSK